MVLQQGEKSKGEERKVLLTDASIHPTSVLLYYRLELHVDQLFLMLLEKVRCCGRSAQLMGC